MSLRTMKSHIVALTGESEEVTAVYLSQAMGAIMNRLYPFEETEEDPVRTFPEKYEGLCERITVYLIHKQGAEGQLLHDENGVKRTYENADIPESMLKQIVPLAKVV